MADFLAAVTSFNPQLLELTTENGIDKRIVCVNYGGIAASLEQRCVCYVDNFSSGHRGATSTEYLFLHLLLFLFLSMKLFLGYLFGDLLEGNEYYVAGYVEFCEVYSKAVKTAIVDHHAAVDSGLRLKLPFSTIFEYLHSTIISLY
ncbi:phosphopantothenate--cysteine ligase 1-like [Arachis ipaensis]|uniref:phosphopantothenate--cysteine ligase 1-like n=1 Tax=Arachis ipaensis TaxID=130454 RepID=UPI0007AFBC1F|nr:phosphopantothenate--cysteine ligase 1-like [Arachis ipaensis]